MPSTLSELWRRRHLLWVLTTSNIKRTNKYTALGWLWRLLDPVLLAVVYYVLVSILFTRRGHQPFALYLIIGLVSFKAFNEAVVLSAAVIRGRAAIVHSVAFPKIVLPLSLVFSSAFFFLFSLVVVALLACWYGPGYGTWPNLQYALLPAVIGCQVLFTVGVDAGRVELEKKNLTHKQATLVETGCFDFDTLGQSFDYALAQSLFTHLPLNNIIVCLMRVEGVLRPGGKLFATFFENPEGKRRLEPRPHPGVEDLDFVTCFDGDPYHYDIETFQWICEDTSLRVERIGEWGHPRDQMMMAFTKA